MLSKSYTIPPSPDYPFFITAKRYWAPESDGNASEDTAAQTLIALHSTSFHKETWEPTLEVLFGLEVDGIKAKRAIIRDAWVIECPNHGESGELNHRALQAPEFAQYFSCQKYAEAVHRFLTASKHQGPHVDFRRRNLVGIGHSLGANAILLLQPIQPAFAVTSLIIIEPLISPEGARHLGKLREALVQSAERRRVAWPSREEVSKTYTNKARTSKWDKKVVEAFVNHATYWDDASKSFRLCCTPDQEITMYNDIHGSTLPVEVLNRVCHTLPTHLILGEVPDFIPKHVQRALINPSSGRRFASLTAVKDFGHLIPQEHPTELAGLLFNILSGNLSVSPSSGAISTLTASTSASSRL